MGSCRSTLEEAELQGRAWWLFEEDGEWLGFSSEVSEALEAAYQHWQEEPEGGALAPEEKEPGRFLYNATIQKSWWNSGYEHGRHKPQAIRRISSAAGSASKLRTRRELEQDLQAARKANEELRVQRDNEAKAHRQRVAELEAELKELKAEVAKQRDSANRLVADLAVACPGRLVALSADPAIVLGDDVGGSLPGEAGALGIGSVGRVRSVEGASVAVHFRPGRPPVWLPSEILELAQQAELLSRPGSRALLPPAAAPGGAVAGRAGERCRGVVCGPLDGAAAQVLGPDGLRHTCLLQDLELDRLPCPDDRPLEVGDFVIVDGSCRQVAGECLGMVLARDGETLCVRCRAEGGGNGGICHGGADFRDIWLPASQLRRDELADRVRPGAAVRFRDRGAESSLLPATALRAAAIAQPLVGVVYAAHADGTAVVDFLGCFGLRCGMELLEACEPPSSLDYAVLRVLGECLSWSEVLAQHAEEREELLLRRWAKPPRPGGGLPRGSPR